MITKRILLAIALISCTLVYGQNHKMDSIQNLIKTEPEDTNKVLNIIFVARSYSNNDNFDTALLNSNRALAMAEKLKAPYFIGMANQTIGVVYQSNGEASIALPYFLKAEKLLEETGRKASLTKVLGSIGINYIDLGNYPKALQYTLQEVKVSEELGKQTRIASGYLNVANVYYYMRDFDKALDYSQRALKIRETLGDKFDIAFALCNIGSMYTGKNDFNRSLDYYLKALAIGEEIKAQRIIVYCTGNIGGIYFKLGQYDKALEYDKKAEQMGKDEGDKNFIALTEDNIGEVLTKMKKYTEAESYLKQALTIDSSTGNVEGSKNAYNTLTNMYVQDKDWQKAYLTYKKYTVTEDSLVNQNKSKEIGKLEAKADYDKQLALQQADDNKKAELSQSESKRQKIAIGLIGSIALAISIIAIIVLRALRVTRKQKATIEEQKTEVEKQKSIVEDKNKDILDSITYAKRLQDAILPPLSTVEKYLPESFILYKPKDIVAGDFYWMEKTGDTIFIAAADCTGHGVPGALVSVVCSNALNRSVKEFKITEPGKILDKTREIVLETFEKSEGEIKDGMDISLASISPSKEGIKIQWAGAYNSLWYFENGEMKELAADKQPIGKMDNPKPFTTHTFTLPSVKGDKAGLLYLFTDGYADQFGGPKGKKFKYKQLHEKLLALANQPMKKQKEALEETMESWKGSLEQVDDILVMGIRIS